MGIKSLEYSFQEDISEENVEQAILSDNKLINAWTGHPHFRIIDNSTEFEEKLEEDEFLDEGV